MNRANNSAFTCSNAFFLSRWQYRNFHSDTTRKSHVQKKDKDNYLIFKKKCCIPLSISFIDTGSFFSALETWKFPGRCIVATFWEILISNQQRKGKGRREGIGGVQRGGGGLQTISITARYLIIKRLVYSALSNPLCTFTSLFDTFF